MTTYTGSYVSVGSGQSVRAEMVVTVSYPGGSLSSGDTYCTVSWTLKLRKNSGAGYANDTSTWSLTGDHAASGSKAWSLGGSGAVATIASGTDTVSLTYSTQSWDVTGSIDHAVLPGVPSVAVSHPVPSRPVTAPAAITGLSAVRVSDSRVDLSWTRNATTSAPYDTIELRRVEHTTGNDAIIAILPGSATSYVDSTTRDNRFYEYLCRPRNAAGTVAFTSPVAVRTTPSIPGTPTVVKMATGDITVRLPGVFSPAATHWDVQHVEDGVDVSTPLVSGVPVSTTSWTHTAPDPAKTHAYRVRMAADGPVGSGWDYLTSAWSARSATVQLQAPPSAPTDVAPDVADATGVVPVSWQHNPVDSSLQSAYEVQWRLVGGSSWTSTGKVSSSVSQHDFAAATWTNGDDVEVQVRTWGADPSASAWSVTHVLTLSAAPVAGITAPDTTWTSQTLTATWTYFDVEASAQSAWVARLLDSAGATLETLSGTGSASSATFATPVADGMSYAVEVEVRDGSGLWSAVASAPFAVDYLPPPTPSIAATWHADDGYATLDVDVAAPVTGEQPVDHLMVERATVGGWVRVADGLTSWPVSLVDMIPPLGTVVTYRVVAVSDIGSEAYAQAAADTAACWLFINHGPGFGQVVRLDSNIDVGRTFGRAKTLHQFVGRRKPVEFAGGSTTRTYSVTATLWNPVLTGGHGEDQSSWEDIEALAEAEAPVIVRDPSGVRLFCSVGDVDESGLHGTTSRVSIPLTEVDWSES